MVVWAWRSGERSGRDEEVPIDREARSWVWVWVWGCMCGAVYAARLVWAHISHGSSVARFSGRVCAGCA
eukprot:scaffold2217_cov132-Isochrysis_galbana.AAC.2